MSALDDAEPGALDLLRFGVPRFLEALRFELVEADNIGDVYRFPNMLAENKNPTAYGADGEYRTQQTKFEHRESSIKNQSKTQLPTSKNPKI